jgi:4-oxalocrotonate tautomerase
LVLPFSEVKERALLRALKRRGYDGLNVSREGREMPVIIVEMYTGRTAEQKAALAKKLTEGTIEILGVRPDQVRVIIHDLPKEDYAVGGKTIAELQGK